MGQAGALLSAQNVAVSARSWFPIRVLVLVPLPVQN